MILVQDRNEKDIIIPTDKSDGPEHLTIIENGARGDLLKATDYTLYFGN